MRAMGRQESFRGRDWASSFGLRAGKVKRGAGRLKP